MVYFGARLFTAWIPSQGYPEESNYLSRCPNGPNSRITTNFGFILSADKRFVKPNYFTYHKDIYSSVNFGGEEIFSLEPDSGDRVRSKDVSEILNRLCVNSIESEYTGYMANCWISLTATCSPSVTSVDYGYIRFEQAGSIINLVPEDTIIKCQDTKDNDLNNLIDCYDDNCKVFTICAGTPTTTIPTETTTTTIPNGGTTTTTIPIIGQCEDTVNQCGGACPPCKTDYTYLLIAGFILFIGVLTWLYFKYGRR